MRPWSGRDLEGWTSKNLAFDVQFVTRPHRPGPAELIEAEADNTARWLQLAIDQETHGHSGRVPAAGCEPGEDGAGRRRLIEMKRLRIEFRGKGLDALLVDPQSSRSEGLAGRVVFEISCHGLPRSVRRAQ